MLVKYVYTTDTVKHPRFSFHPDWDRGYDPYRVWILNTPYDDFIALDPQGKVETALKELKVCIQQFCANEDLMAQYFHDPVSYTHLTLPTIYSV